jgi:hypothetical protein
MEDFVVAIKATEYPGNLAGGFILSAVLLDRNPAWQPLPGPVQDWSHRQHPANIQVCKPENEPQGKQSTAGSHSACWSTV